MVAGVRLVREIVIGSRVRTDDSAEVDALAKSISETGLRHAITIDTNNNLIAGYRRLMSYNRLGWRQIKVNIVKDLDGLALVLAMERDDDTERSAMNNVDILAFVTAISRLDYPDGRSRKSRAIAESNRRRHAGLGPIEVPRLTWQERAPGEPRTIIGKAIGLSPATTSRLLGISRRMFSDEPVTHELAVIAQQEIAAGVAIHTAYERMTLEIRKANHPERFPESEPKPEPEPESATALAYRLRRREEMVTAKFQREIVGQAVETARSLVTVFGHIADKLNTYGVNEEITPDEQERWLKDIALTRTALNKASRAIKGGYKPNGKAEQ